MANSKKPRKKYVPKGIVKASPLVNRKLNDQERANYRENLRTSLIALHMGSADKQMTDNLGTILGYGYVLSVNFLEEENLQKVFKKGIQALYRIRCAFDTRKTVNEEDLHCVEEAGKAALEVLFSMDLFSLGKMAKIFRTAGQEIIDACVKEIGGNTRPKVLPSGERTVCQLPEKS